MHAHVFPASLDGIQPGFFSSRVAFGDHAVDLAFVFFEEGVDVFLVDEDGALFARQHEVEVDAEADPGVEGHPGEDEVELRFDEEEEREGGPVHQPWRQDCRVGGAEGFVGGEDGEEDGGDGAVIQLVWSCTECGTGS